MILCIRNIVHWKEGKEMEIYSWNVNGLRAVSTKGFFDFFSEESPDILCISGN